MRPLKFALSTLALIADVIRSMLKTRLTLGNICLVLLNLVKRFIFVMFKLLHPHNIYTVNIDIFSLVRQLPLLALTFAAFHTRLVGVLICIFNG